MRAIHQHRYGGSEQLSLTEVPDPTPGPNDVVVRVRAAGVDRGTWHLMAGHPYAVRLAFGLRRPKHPVPGRDVSGVVAEVGSLVTTVAVGEEVIGTADGSFAELAVVPESRMARKPAGLSFEEAATLPVSGLTALQAVRDAARIGPGDRVLVIGASGGVGSYAVQIAKAYGAEVTGVASGPKADLVLALGATRVIDYTREDLDDGTRYDAVLDIAGLRPIRQLRRLLTETGTLVIVGGEGGDRWLGGTHRQLAALALSRFVSQRLTALLSKEKGDDLDVLGRLVDDGAVRPALERTYALHEAAKAIDHVASGHARGKVALTP
ncbi:NAD(P)-dependent alcohol dehydrogenase [Nocardioides sp.]|jgi:NADPH:quinone reductase-like Zn-dependent oxidoreductase|uniref:NAD(P)-dependent alcohol dehydrogenase n=1 Tax=Nocardioides sp. TaxID=35761 RepID=UPI001DCA2E45|nr:NAD(P)-dependent alcohol dehydrogenase [Nocardioides sp.]MBU1801360.1 NAD(P)-dependent alcohol dehydrogenase [Actinomycetota bacterium]